MATTIRYCPASHEYQARNMQGKVVGTCVYLKEAGDAGLWRYDIPGHGAWTNEDREKALTGFAGKCTELFGHEQV